MEGVVKVDKVYLIVLLQAFHQSTLDSSPDASQSRRDRDGDLGGTQSTLQAFPLGLFVLVLPITEGKILKGNLGGQQLFLGY